MLRNVAITRPDQVWSSDITYIPLRHGFLYLVAIMDWFSRYVLSWRLSNTLHGSFCLEALEDALRGGRPEIFNSDQGSQFTAVAFTRRVAACGAAISMDGRGRVTGFAQKHLPNRGMQFSIIVLRCCANSQMRYKANGDRCRTITEDNE